MSVIDESKLEIIYTEYDNFTRYENKKAKFNTKIASDMKHNDEIVDVLGFLKGKDTYNDRYVVRFNDDTIDDNIMTVELVFDYVIDPVQEDTRRILSKIIKSYDLNNKEIEELQIAVINFDYEANEGVIFLDVESIERLFTDEDSEKTIQPSLKQLKALAEYIKETEKYYSLYKYEDYTEKTINSILSKNENDISRLELLGEEQLKFYDKNEIKQILKSKERLVYVDNGIDEVVIKYKDIPDFIVNVNEKLGMVDLKVFDFRNPTSTPLLSTYGEFLNQCDPKVREDIIDRLVKLQTGAEKCREYKVIDEDILEEAKEEMNQEKKTKNKNKER